MRVLRLILAGLGGLAILFGGLLVAVAVVVGGLLAFLVQLIRPRPAATGPQSPHRSSAMRTDGVIDVEATRLPSEPDGR